MLDVGCDFIGLFSFFPLFNDFLGSHIHCLIPFLLGLDFQSYFFWILFIVFFLQFLNLAFLFILDIPGLSFEYKCNLDDGIPQIRASVSDHSAAAIFNPLQLFLRVVQFSVAFDLVGADLFVDFWNQLLFPRKQVLLVLTALEVIFHSVELDGHDLCDIISEGGVYSE